MAEIETANTRAFETLYLCRGMWSSYCGVSTIGLDWLGFVSSGLKVQIMAGS